MRISRAALSRHTLALMADFGVSGYGVKFGRLSGAWAHCDYNRKELKFHPSLLECDWVFANQIALHEVAHALAGPRAGHGRDWMKTARGMGYRLGVTVAYSSPINGEHKWVARCLVGQHHAIRYERGAADGELMCLPCFEGGAGEVPVLWEAL